MANDKAATDSLPELAARLAAVESLAAAQGSALRQAQGTLDAALKEFSPVAARVQELSSAFQEANTRLGEVQDTLAGMSDQTELAAQVAQVRDSLGVMETRLTGIETTRARSGRLGARLAGIEEALAKLAGGGNEPTGGTQ